jgi:hypothetical protein
MAEDFSSHLNSLIRELPIKSSFLLRVSEESDDPEAYAFKHAFKLKGKPLIPNNRVVSSGNDLYGELNKAHFFEHSLPRISYDRAISHITQKIESSSTNCLVEDLLGVEYITNNYNVSYDEFIHTLVFATYVDRRIAVNPWFGSSVLISNR